MLGKSRQACKVQTGYARRGHTRLAAWGRHACHNQVQGEPAMSPMPRIVGRGSVENHNRHHTGTRTRG
jgi:hypothetical protein